MAAKPALGMVRITSSDPNITLRARLADERPNVEAGYGGWAEIARPRRAPLSVWVGSPALRMTLPILFDRYREALSVEREISDLERLAMPTSSDGSTPRVRIVARGGAVPHQGRTWVIDSLAWGIAAMNHNGNRTRQQATLSLLEWIADVRVEEFSPAKRQRAKSKAATTKAGAANKRVVASRGRSVTTSSGASLLAVAGESSDFGQGEDLASIAARELGSAGRWPEIAALNGIRDPRAIKPGQIIRLP